MSSGRHRRDDAPRGGVGPVAWLAGDPGAVRALAEMARDAAAAGRPFVEDDAALWLGFRAREPRAAAVWAETYGPRLVDLLVRTGATHEEAEDLVQATFARVIDGPPGAAYRGHGPLLAWLRTSVYRRFLRARQTEKGREALTDPVALDTLARLHTSSPYEVALIERYLPVIRRALVATVAALSAGDRQLWALRAIDGLSTTQIAAVVGRHRVTVHHDLQGLFALLKSRIRAAIAHDGDLRPASVSSIVRLVLGAVDDPGLPEGRG